MNRLTVDFNQLLSGLDLMPFFIVTSGIIAFWVLMVWIVMFIISRMR